MLPGKYKYGFKTNIASDSFPKGLDEQTIRNISARREEPPFLLDFRLRGYRAWQKLSPPRWAQLTFSDLDLQGISYFSEPKSKPRLDNLKQVDPELLRTFDRLGIPIAEQHLLANVAIDFVFDSVSLGTTWKQQLTDAGVIFCSLREAARSFPELIERYLGKVVSFSDNYYAALNAAVFSDGSFVYVPAGIKCPCDLSTYFRLNNSEVGQFERTLIIAEADSQVSYLEGCTAPAYDSHQLHAAVVELIALEQAQIDYATVQNWYAGEGGKGGVYNFVTKRGKCIGDKSRISWTQVEVGAAITWKYPSCILQGDGSQGTFSSIAITTGDMQADTGTKMIHIGKNTRSTIIAKGICADNSSNAYRSLVQVAHSALAARNYTQCDSMLIGEKSSAFTLPTIEGNAHLEHEASTCKLSEEQLFYLQTRGLSREQSIKSIVNAFCQSVLSKLPFEFAAEAEELLALKLENSVG